MDFETWFKAKHPDIPLVGALAVIALKEEGATVPFIARYRKERTGNLDEVAIEKILEAKGYWDDIVKRKSFILSEIESQGKLTPELKQKIESSYKLSVLEDLYLPYKRKRKTKATVAKDAGLEPFAEWIWDCGHRVIKASSGESIEKKAESFLNAEAGFPDIASVIEGAQNILTERLAEIADLRALLRAELFERGHIYSRKAKGVKPNSKFEHYFDYNEAIQSLLKAESGHRYLAIRRGEAEGELSLKIAGPPNDSSFEERLLKHYQRAACVVPEAPGAATLLAAASAALKRYVVPAIETEIHSTLKDAADRGAIHVFAENVRKLLLAAPLGAKCVLGVDPGIRTGCKLALVDDSGYHVANTVMHIQTEEKRKNASDMLRSVIDKSKPQAIAVGNGTASRETEAFLREALTKLKCTIPIVMVSEAGASVYSASKVAREEFPDLDLTVRGAISIARRLQDPLAELVKVDPKSIGVGQYQHDVSQSALRDSLVRVVESCVNSVGVNLNTASEHLLANVSGIGPSLAKAIVKHRGKKGLFTSRKELLKVSRFGGKAFEQSAGFLRIPNAKNPLDNTGVHPERYDTLQACAQRLGKKLPTLIGEGAKALLSDAVLKEELGNYTFEDVVKELEKPGLDPREEFVPFEFRKDIHELDDLIPDMTCPGIVTNVTNFGAFVDIGVHQDGLVHISELSDTFTKDPRSVVSPGDHVHVRVLEINKEKKQIALSMKKENSARPGGIKKDSAPSPQSRNKPARNDSTEEKLTHSPFANLGSMLNKEG